MTGIVLSACLAALLGLFGPSAQDPRPAEPPRLQGASPAPVTVPSPAPRYAGRRLSEVLEELRAAGLKLVYSSRLVRPQMLVTEEPKARVPRLLLDELLAPHDLVARGGPADTVIVVQRSATEAGDAAQPAGMRLGFHEDVNVAGSSESGPESGSGTVRLSGQDVLEVPGAIDNVFRALQLMPGVTAAGLFDGRLAVRGGAPDQNLTIMDGVEIHNPFRVFGAVAGPNPDTVSRFELSAGAFPARFGDRLSSVLLVETRDGRRDRPFGGSVSTSVTDTSAVFEGRLPGPGSWLLAGRRTYYDLVAERFLSQELPTFADLQLRLAWGWPSGRRFSVTGLLSREDANADFSDAVDRVNLQSKGRNDLLAASFETPLGGGATLRTVASAYRFTETLQFDLLGLTDTRVSFDRPTVSARGDASDQLLRLSQSRRVSLQDFALRQEASFALSRENVLDVGLELHRLDTAWRHRLSGDRSSEEANGSSAIFGASLPALLDSTLASTRLALFAQHRLLLGERLALEPGLRVERTGITRETALSPRLHLGLELPGVGRLKAGAGLHSQSPGYEKLVHSDYFLDLSEAARLGLRNEQALHLVLGLERVVGSSLFASLEGYYRGFSRLAVGRLETESERLERVARYDYPERLRWGVPLAPRITSLPVNDASGSAYGLLAFVKKKDQAGARLSGWLSYAFGVAERTAYGRTYPFDYDRRHVLAGVLNLGLGPNLHAGFSIQAASGLPTTPPRGVLVLGAEDRGDVDGDGDTSELVPARDDRRHPIYVADPGGAETLNADRLPFFARLDLRLGYRPRGPQGRWLFFLEVLNLFGRRNAAGYDWNIRLDPGAERPRIEVSEGEDGIPRLPSFGVRFRF
jgi:hypothetical protein